VRSIQIIYAISVFDAGKATKSNSEVLFIPPLFIIVHDKEEVLGRTLEPTFL
jgi:hypothetical protein